MLSDALISRDNFMKGNYYAPLSLSIFLSYLSIPLSLSLDELGQSAAFPYFSKFPAFYNTGKIYNNTTTSAEFFSDLQVAELPLPY